MKRLTILVLLLLSLSASSQTYIKSNALYWVGLLPNVQVETRLSDNFTFQGELNASLWESVFDDRPLMGLQAIAGFRWYPKQAFKGFYVGVDASFDVYKVSNFITLYPPYKVQHGVGMYYGLTLGYQLSIGKRWNMDFYAGGGWHLGWYYGVDTRTGELFVPWNKSGEWLPYKLGVAFAYRLTSDKRMAKHLK